MGRKYLFISEVLSPPFDEGIKNVAYSVHKNLKLKFRTLSVTKAAASVDNSEILAIGLNKLFLNYGLKKLIKSYDPDLILYLPEASITFNSFVRAKFLKFMSGFSKVVILGVKQVEYSALQRHIIINFIRPDLLLLLGKFELDFFLKNGLKVKVLPPAVDSIRFCQATQGEKERIRAEYGILKNKKVVLHVGHIRPTRNVQCLSKIQEIEDVQVVIIGSTSTPTENDLKDKLVKDGVLVIDRYIQDISDVYKMADAYIFPVFNKIACIDMPLSILEALACNLPVITTRFGGLEDHFKEDQGFKYCDTEDQLFRLVKDIKLTGVNNTVKVSSFTWNNLSDELTAACNKLI